MDNPPADVLSSKQRQFHICICILATTLVASGAFVVDTTFENNREDSSLKKLWEHYILPRLELELSRKQMQFTKEGETPIVGDYTDEIVTEKDKHDSARVKRLGISGLENFDLMTKTLDQSRLPMSVSNMSFNKLRSLMRQAGRRKK